MRVFLFGYFDIPPNMAPIKRSLCLAKGLTINGVDVILESIHKIEKETVPASGVYEGVKFNFINTKVKSRNRFDLYLDIKIRDRRDAVRYINLNTNKGDIIYIYSSNTADIYSLANAAHKKGAKVVLELVEIPYYSESMFAKCKRFIQQTFVYPRLDGFSCISIELMHYAQKHASKKAKFINVPILVEKYSEDLDNPILDFPYIIHTGTMIEQKDGISIILKAFATFKKEDKSGCKLVFAGPHSNEHCSFIPMMKELGICEDVMLLGMIKNQDTLSNLQRFATMSIVYRYDNIQTRHGFSTKMGEILMSGVPLITTPIGGHSDYLKDGQNAFIVEPGNVIALSNKIIYITSHPKEAKKVGEEGRILAGADFNPIIQGKRLKHFFQSL